MNRLAWWLDSGKPEQRTYCTDFQPATSRGGFLLRARLRDTAIQVVTTSNVHGGEVHATVTHRTWRGDAEESVTTSQLEGCQAHLVRNITPIRVPYSLTEGEMNEQQQNEELQKRTEQALNEARPFISAESYQLLCWHCGMAPKFLSALKQQEKKHEMVG